jgi:CheY-like chemotaxis protein
MTSLACTNRHHASAGSIFASTALIVSLLQASFTDGQNCGTFLGGGSMSIQALTVATANCDVSIRTLNSYSGLSRKGESSTTERGWESRSCRDAEEVVLTQENIRKASQFHFEIAGAVEDGEAALETAVQHAPDVLLLEISLPGFAIAEKLNEANAAAKVIFVAAHSDRNVDRPAIRAVADGEFYQSPLIG